MKEYFLNLYNQIKNVWKNLDTRQKIVFTSVITAVILFMIFIMYYSTRPQYVVLFNKSISEADAGKISDKLKEWGVTPKIDKGVLKVPLKEKEELRMRLATENLLPTGSPGFELFDKYSFGLTESERKVKYQRALEGELQRSLETIDTIEEARVHLNIPEKRLFTKKQLSAKASVILKLKPGSSLGTGQVKGIVSLVSYAVEGLQPENVTVEDNTGKILSVFEDENTLENKKSKQQEIEYKIEKKLERDLYNKLAYMLTGDKVTVQVNVEMDFDRVEKEIQNFKKPEGSFDQLKESEEIKKEEFEGKGLKPGGVPGIQSNVPSYQAIKETPVKYSSSHNITNYLADKVITKLIKSPAIKRITAFVTVDGTYKIEKNKDGTLKRTYIKREDEDMRKISEITKAALGYDELRGDRVVVENIQFDRTREFAAQDQEILEKQQRQKMITNIFISILAVFAAGLIFAVIRYRQKKRAELARKRALEEERKRLQQSLMEGVGIEDDSARKLRRKIEDAAKTHPKVVAQIIKTWIINEE